MNPAMVTGVVLALVGVSLFCSFEAFLLLLAATALGVWAGMLVYVLKDSSKKTGGIK